MRSQPVEIDVGEGGVCQLRVRSNLGGWRGFRFTFLLSMMLILAMILISSTNGFGFTNPSDRFWLTMVMTPTAMLPALVQIASHVVRRDHFLRVDEDPSVESGRPPVRIPTGATGSPAGHDPGMMIAVAILALILGAWIEWARYTRRNSFQNRASVHANSEVPFRTIEKDYARSAEAWMKSGLQPSYPSPTRGQGDRSGRLLCGDEGAEYRGGRRPTMAHGRARPTRAPVALSAARPPSRCGS